MIPAVDAVGHSSTFDDIKCIWLNFLVSFDDVFR
jgi:hypothetical protein